MSYLIAQIFFCLLIAFLLGLFLGWLLFRCRRHEHNGVCRDNNANGNITHTAAPVQTPAPVAEVTAPKPSSPPVSAGFSADMLAPAAPSLDTRVELTGQAYDIETLEGIGPKIGERMREAGMETIKDFISRARLPEHREQIAQLARVMRSDVDLWAGMSDLMRIPGLNHQASELIYKTGVKTAEELGAVNASEFKEKAEAVNAAGAKRIAPTVPALEEFMNFIAIAKQLKPFVKF